MNLDESSQEDDSEEVKEALTALDECIRNAADEVNSSNFRFSVHEWREGFLDVAITYERFGDAVDEVSDAIEEKREDEEEAVFSMMVQALHDDMVCFAVWTLPSSAAVYTESSHGPCNVIGVDLEGFSDERAAAIVARYLRERYMEVEEGEQTLIVSPLDVSYNLKTMTPEAEMLIEAGKVAGE